MIQTDSQFANSNNLSVEFLTGSAGTGKTTEIINRIQNARSNGNRHYGTLCATTGIAAMNLSGSSEESTVTTVNSVLRYYNLQSLKEAYAEGKLQKALLRVLANGANLVVDEISMMNSETLDIIMMAMKEVNDLEVCRKRGGLGLVLTGDFCQLPPVEGKYAFEAECWPLFADNTTRLTKVWRQDNLEFLEAINAARRGDGDRCAEVLSSLSRSGGNIFHPTTDNSFDGTTICALNRDVDRINNIRLHELLSQGKRKIEFKSFRWGIQSGEWKLIPDVLTMCEEAYVMILVNKSIGGMMEYANGSCGHVKTAMVEAGKTFIKLKKGDREVVVRKVTRRMMTRDKPFGCEDPTDPMTKGEYKEYLKKMGEDGYYEDEKEDEFGNESSNDPYKQYLMRLTLERRHGSTEPYYDYEQKKWVVGEVTHMPLRLAYASTVHKTQGLTLDSVQLEPYNRFFGSPSMMYVALSRVKSHEGLRIVGSPELVVERTNVVEDILPWI